MPLLKNNEDETAFETLYKQYLNLMLYTANSILKNQADSEDAVQMAFIRIAKNFDKIEKTICPKTANQFVIIVRHIAIDIYRKKHREAAVELLEEICEYKSNTDLRLEINSAMAQLPQSQRDILYMVTKKRTRTRIGIFFQEPKPSRKFPILCASLCQQELP